MQGVNKRPRTSASFQSQIAPSHFKKTLSALCLVLKINRTRLTYAAIRRTSRDTWSIRKQIDGSLQRCRGPFSADVQASAEAAPKKLLPLSSQTINAGKFLTVILRIASMPRSSKSTTSTLRIFSLARIAAGPPIDPK